MKDDESNHLCQLVMLHVGQVCMNGQPSFILGVLNRFVDIECELSYHWDHSHHLRLSFVHPRTLNTCKRVVAEISRRNCAESTLRKPFWKQLMLGFLALEAEGYRGP